jgi:hypothetical protein
MNLNLKSRLLSAGLLFALAAVPTAASARTSLAILGTPVPITNACYEIVESGVVHALDSAGCTSTTDAQGWSIPLVMDTTGAKSPVVNVCVSTGVTSSVSCDLFKITPSGVQSSNGYEDSVGTGCQAITTSLTLATGDAAGIFCEIGQDSEIVSVSYTP